MIRISVISYLNSLPFAWCLEHSAVIDEIELSYDIPSQCADKLLSGEVDVGLIPIVEILKMPEFYIISDLCIGAGDGVRTVILASETVLEKITTIFLDSHSRTSIALCKILAKHYWKITPEWVHLTGDVTKFPRDGSSAAVVIGDKAFEMQMPYTYDFSTEWRNFSNLPFVFACWVANKPIDNDFINRFNEAISGIAVNMQEIAEYYRDLAPKGIDLLEYWTENISYQLTEDKRKGLELFLKYASSSNL